MNIYHWLTDRFSPRGKALSLYQRGMARARKHDHQGAIADYTATIDIPATPPDVRAMALYNRALVYDAVDEESLAIEDLNLILTMPAAHANVKTEAKRKLVRIERRAQKHSV
jgi:regulator of sirC expression with transglutaminase-like and TPR domain